jgi:hypothetical protein
MLGLIFFSILINPSLSLTTLELAIWEQETNKRTGIIWGDQGDSLGPLQISEAAFIDSGVQGEWKDCRYLSVSLEVFRKYQQRYANARRLKRIPTNQDRARIWNGGPNGWKRNSTLKYWHSVKEKL